MINEIISNLSDISISSKRILIILKLIENLLINGDK